MKKLILIAGLFTIVSTANCQKNTLINTKDLSAFSFGAMPVIFASADQGAGLGLELNTRYALTQNFGVGAFGRMKSLLDGTGSSSYNEYAPVATSTGIESRNIFGAGITADYNIFRSLVLQVRGGYEAEADVTQRKMLPRFIVGGGLIINFNKSQTHKVGHSLRFMVDFENNRHFGITVPEPDFSDFPYSQSVNETGARINAFSFQVGWNFQFHSIKRKR